MHASRLACVGHASRLARVGHASSLACGTYFMSGMWDMLHVWYVGHASHLTRVGHASRLARGTCFTSDTWDIQQALASFLPSKLCSYKAEPLKGRPVKWFWVPVLSLQGLRSGSQALIWKRWGSFSHLLSDQALVWRAKMKPSGSLALAVVLNTPIYATQLLQGHKWGVLAEIQKSKSTCPSSLPESHCLFRC